MAAIRDRVLTWRGDGTRTRDPPIMSRPLSLLSYTPPCEPWRCRDSVAVFEFISVVQAAMNMLVTSSARPFTVRVGLSGYSIQSLRYRCDKHPK